MDEYKNVEHLYWKVPDVLIESNHVYIMCSYLLIKLWLEGKYKMEIPLVYMQIKYSRSDIN